MKVEIISCLRDNYSYLIIDETNNLACVVDPSEARPIIDYLKNKNINLKVRCFLPPTIGGVIGKKACAK